jgi:hypothetical protein
MKTILLYVLVLLGIPNVAGLVLGFPFAILVGSIPRRIYPRISINSPFLNVPVGLIEGAGCGAAGILLVRLFGHLPGGVIPIISSAWALFYYYSRGQSKVEAWANVAGIYAAWAGYWILYAT